MFALIGIIIGFYAGNLMGRGTVGLPNLLMFALLFGGVSIAVIVTEILIGVFF